jgi:oxalate decarboxylase/phosphoglucose isomerase-like protein (cupin superfamily)
MRWLPQFTFLIFELLSIVASAPTKGIDIIALLTTAASEEDRIDLLSDSDFVFDFLNPPAGSVVSGLDGTITAAKRKNFPALVGNNIAMSIGILGPCGLNTPHTHPRAAEFNLAVNGTLRTGMLANNQARFVMNELQPGQATIFPQAAIHFEQNLGCDTVMFVAAFSNEDPGVTQIANQFFNLPSDIVEATMGDSISQMASSGLTVQDVQMAIPSNVAFGVQDCLQKCGIQTGKAKNSGSRSRGSWKWFHICLSLVLGLYLRG